jgi:hypothetical protein
LKQGIFERAHYPVEPRDFPRVVIEVEAIGSLDEAIAWAIIASAEEVPGTFVPDAKRRVFRDLADRIADAVARLSPAAKS